MVGVAKAFEGLGNILNVVVALVAVVGGLFYSVPASVALASIFMAIAIFIFSLVPFHVDTFDVNNVATANRSNALYQQRILRGFRNAIRIACPVIFAAILICSIGWGQAPSVITRQAAGVVQEELARPSGKEAIRYVAAPALTVTRVPQQAGVPVVAPEPSAESLRSRREVAALPLSFVLARVLGDPGDLFGGKAWDIFFLSVFLGIVAWLSDRLNFRSYVGPPTGDPSA